MQQTNLPLEFEEITRSAASSGGTKVGAGAGTLATLRTESESLAEVAHDARNMMTALGLYCDLLEEPGVLAVPYLHYSHELRLVASASRRLVERLVTLDAVGVPATSIEPLSRASSRKEPVSAAATRSEAWNRGRGTERGLERNEDRDRRWDLLPALPVTNLAAELMANRNLLSALAGPSIAVTIDAVSGTQPVRLTGEDLTRVLVNLVKNAAEAMPDGGRLHIGIQEQPAAAGASASLRLTVEDDGPGIPEGALERIFLPGYTSRARGEQGDNRMLNHRGLGLAVTRSIVEAAGGRINARNRAQGGACIEIELPLRKTGG